MQIHLVDKDLYTEPVVRRDKESVFRVVDKLTLTNLWLESVRQPDGQFLLEQVRGQVQLRYDYFRYGINMLAMFAQLAQLATVHHTNLSLSLDAQFYYTQLPPNLFDQFERVHISELDLKAAFLEMPISDCDHSDSNGPAAASSVIEPKSHHQQKQHSSSRLFRPLRNLKK